MIKPPSAGPALAPKAITTALHPKAKPRLSKEKLSVIIATLVESRSAPPRPWKARAAIRSDSEFAAPQTPEPRVKSANPESHTGLRPTMSDKRPKVSNVEAMVTR